MDVIAQMRKDRLAQEGARAGGFKLRKIQREVGCQSCHWFDLEDAIKDLPYCGAPVNFGDMTIEVLVNHEPEGPDVRHVCHKWKRIEGTERSESPILEKGGRNVARSETRGQVL